MSVDAETLVELTQAVWASFVDPELPLLDLGDAPADDGPDGNVIGTIEIEGPEAGLLRVTMPAQAASDAAARMFDIDADTVVDADVQDATGEIANMIGGNVKAMLSGDHRLGLPSVVAQRSPARAEGETVASATLLWGEHTVLVTLDRTRGERP